MGYSVADLFATLGVKIDDKDLQQLKQFDELFKSSASSVRALRDELKALGAIRLPTSSGGGVVAGTAPVRSSVEQQEARMWREKEREEDRVARQEKRLWAERDREAERAAREAKKGERREASEWAAVQSRAEGDDRAQKRLAERAARDTERAQREAQRLAQREASEWAAVQSRAERDDKAQKRLAQREASEWAAVQARAEKEKKAQEEAADRAVREAARFEAAQDRERKRQEREKEREEEEEGQPDFWRSRGGAGGSLEGAIVKGLIGFSTLAGALTFAVLSIKKMASASSEAADKTSRFTTVTGLTNREMAKWQRFAAVSGVSEEEMLQTLKSLQQARVKAKYGGGWGAWELPGGGVDPNQDPGKVLAQLAAKTSKMRPEEAQFWLNRVGVSESALYAFRKYGDRLSSTTSVSETDVENIRQMNSAFGELRFTLSQINTAALAELARDIRPLLDALNRAATGAAAISREPGGTRALIGTAMGNPFAVLPYLARRVLGGGVTQHNTITVNGAQNPEETGRVIDQHIRRQADNAYRKAPDPSQNR